MRVLEVGRRMGLSALSVLLVACSSPTAPSLPAPASEVADTGSEQDESDAATATGKTHAVRVANFVYEPAKLTIKVGDAVKWTVAEGTHTVTSGTKCTADGKFDSKAKTVRGTYTRVFDTPGTFNYFCDYREHCSHGQVGVIEVRP